MSGGDLERASDRDSGERLLLSTTEGDENLLLMEARDAAAAAEAAV